MSIPFKPGAFVARQHLTKQQFAYQSLRDAIIRCELGPGDRLVIDDLAKRLKLSIIPVREALRLLESERLVVSVAHVGATVAPISRESIGEIFAVLEGLEAVSTREAARRGQPKDFIELDTIVSAMDDSLSDGNPAQWAELNGEFHLMIGNLSRMPLLEQMLQRALDHWNRIRRYFFSGVLVYRTDLAQREHRQLMAEMKANDLAALERTIREHNQGALAAYTAYLDGVPAAHPHVAGRRS